MPPVKVIWDDAVKLDDCSTQSISIGTLSLRAIYFGETSTISDHLQRCLNSPAKLERNQCTLVALAAGLVSRTQGKERNNPTAARVRKLAAELRWGWANSANGAFVETRPNSTNEKIVASLRRDARNPNHDRDYRGLCIFLSAFLESQQYAVLVFDTLRSGAGDTPLQLNISGDLSIGRRH